jgi:hypothetical protein
MHGTREERAGPFGSAGGSQLEIIVDGVSRSFRDVKAIALEAGCFLKERQRTQSVSVRDLRDGTVVEIGWEAGRVFVKVPPGGN